MKVIMLGKLRSGKTTCANLVKELVNENLGYKLINKPLAAPIYAELYEFYEKHGLVLRKNRRFMEGVGEALNDDYPGGDKIVELYAESFNPSEHIIVEDCRRKTQADFFRKYNAIFIRIKSNDEIRKSRCKPGEWAEGHITDTELDNYPVDFEITNNGSDLQELRSKVLEQVVLKLENYGKENKSNSA